MSERDAIVDVPSAAIDPEEILTLRRGPGANCSSIGSALDVLFLSATLAGVILVSVAAAFGGERGREAEGDPPEGADDAGAG